MNKRKKFSWWSSLFTSSLRSKKYLFNTVPVPVLNGNVLKSLNINYAKLELCKHRG
jgi:hypothetical protein